jgi:hypothetical protein
MRKEWKGFRALEGEPVPKQTKPVEAPKVEPKKEPTADPVPFKKVIPRTKSVVQPQPLEDIPPSPQPIPMKTLFSFSFYNTGCKVSLDASCRFSLRDASENSVADAWKILSGSRYNDLLNDCLRLRRELNLCDWGYMEMGRALTERFFGKACNEAVLMQMFILSQSGYKVRIARAGEQLALLVPFQQGIYEYSYLAIDGLKYYVMNKKLVGQQIYVFNKEFPHEQFVSLKMSQPHFSLAATQPKTFSSRLYPDLSVSVSTNKNLIDFYNTYPLSSEWNLYALASMSETLKGDLYPAIRRQIAGKSEKEATLILLNFVQTAFKYQTDPEQFGYERPLFADETFYYPYSDCEDRSILFAALVRDLLQLDVILLLYPGHLATAVCFHEKVEGDYMGIDGQTYIICDPTYINAGIGEAMPQYKHTGANVVKL